MTTEPRNDDGPGAVTPRGLSEIAAPTTKRAPAVSDRVTDEADTPGDLDPAKVARFLELSDERDRWERLCLAAYREGWRAAELAHADDYDRGLFDGAMARKRAQHDLVDMARTDTLTWGPGGREHFGDPRPGELSGAALVARARQSWLDAGLTLGPGPGWVHLGGRTVHHHRCTDVCSYRPGWYTTAEAIGIISRLPGNYDAVLADLRGQQDGEAA